LLLRGGRLLTTLTAATAASATTLRDETDADPGNDECENKCSFHM